jgi:putative phosphoribosyl transferase
MHYQNRVEAGRQLACELMAYADRRDTIVLALPRGGVPVGYEVARTLRAPLDVFVVRKLGAPGNEELAMGAIASGGVRVLNDEVAGMVPDEVIEQVVAREMEELKRREIKYRGDRPFPSLCGRTVILVDDGIATGATMKAAIAAVRHEVPTRTVVAVPVAPRSSREEFSSLVDEFVCPLMPMGFYAVGQWYENFAQTTDDEVRELLAKAAERLAAGAEREK